MNGVGEATASLQGRGGLHDVMTIIGMRLRKVDFPTPAIRSTLFLALDRFVPPYPSAPQIQPFPTVKGPPYFTRGDVTCPTFDYKRRRDWATKWRG
jgi:hypothetical protein